MVRTSILCVPWHDQSVCQADAKSCSSNATTPRTDAEFCVIDNAAPLKDQKKIKTIEKVCVILLVAPTMPR